MEWPRSRTCCLTSWPGIRSTERSRSFRIRAKSRGARWRRSPSTSTRPMPSTFSSPTERVRLLNTYIFIETFPKSRPDKLYFSRKKVRGMKSELEEEECIYLYSRDWFWIPVIPGEKSSEKSRERRRWVGENSISRQLFSPEFSYIPFSKLRMNAVCFQRVMILKPWMLILQLYKTIFWRGSAFVIDCAGKNYSFEIFSFLTFLFKRVLIISYLISTILIRKSMKFYPLID